MTYTDTDIARLPLAEAKEELFAQLVATPYDASDRTSAQHRHRRVVRVALACVSAAAVTAIGATVVVHGPAGAPSAGSNEPSSVRIGAERKGDAAARPSSSAPADVVFSAKLVAMAEQTPRIVLDAAGWTVENVEGFGKEAGSLGFQNGDERLSLDWSPAEDYDERRSKWDYDTETTDTTRAATKLFGREARLYTLGPVDHVTLLQPDGGSYVEVRGSGLSEREYLELTSHLRQVTAQEFLEAMPASVVRPGQHGEAAQRVLADIPVPPGFVFDPNSGFNDGNDVNDPYTFGAAVTGQVVYAWAEVYRTGDAAAKKQAVAALESSHDWKVLADMDDAGDWSETIWEYADRIAAGDLPSREELGGALGLSTE